MSGTKTNLVYSTNPEVMKQPKQTGTEITLAGQSAKIQREVKGRGGKTVTAIIGLKGELRPLLKELQKHCGTGGSVKNGRIEIQGEQGDKIKSYLEQKGIKAKLSGGY